MREVSDEKLMEFYANGDFEAFEILYCRYSNRLYGYLKNKVQHQYVDDMCQQIWSKFHTKRMLYKKEFKFAPWFFVLAKNTIIDHYRKDGKESFTEFEEGQHCDLKESEKLALRMELLDELAQLEPAYKDVLSMRYIDDLNFDEIAKSLNITESNTRKRVSRGLKKLKDLWHRGDHE